jgi:hypothetical protein
VLRTGNFSEILRSNRKGPSTLLLDKEFIRVSSLLALALVLFIKKPREGL